MRKLLVATRSKGKIPEIASLLTGLGVELLSLNDTAEIPQDYEVEEAAKTLEGNAIIKAMTFGCKAGLLTLADDTGLEVDSLGGSPGIYSARYASGTDKDRYNKLLKVLRDVPDEQRTARFRTVVALYDPETEKVRTCGGVCEGKITRKPLGKHGFGYDPVFWCIELAKTNAQMTPEEKNRVSHRGKAMCTARAVLQKEFL